MSYITTFTGKHFDPIHPVPEKIDMKDIAHALSLICRANGHTRFFYSVAQHSIACCKEAKTRGLSNHIQLGCLLHDSCETYMSNVTRPIKAKLTEYLKLEAPYKIRFGIILLPPSRMQKRKQYLKLTTRCFLMIKDSRHPKPTIS